MFLLIGELICTAVNPTKHPRFFFGQVQTRFQHQSEIIWTRKPTPGADPDTNFGAPTAPSRNLHGSGNSSLSPSCRNLLKSPSSPITSSHEIPNVFIWYWPFKNCWPETISVLATSNIPHGGVWGPPPSPRFATLDDDTKATSELVGLLPAHELNKVVTITRPIKPMGAHALGRRKCQQLIALLWDMGVLAE